jgi:DNA polymerase elongation subunit (family B)
MKIRGVIARKGDTPEYVRRMQQELFDVLAMARSLDELRNVEPTAREVYGKYLRELEDADVRDLAIHRRISRMNYSRKCAEASAVKAYQKSGLPLATGMEIGYVVTDAAKWEVDTEEMPLSLMLDITGSCWKRHGTKWLSSYYTI